MAKLYNLARMSTATTGTGTITLGSAVSGYLTFALAGVANTDVVSYGIKDGSNSEVGTGTYTSAGTTLTRTPTKSTNGDAAISLSGTAEVFITPRKEDLLSITETRTANQVFAGPTSGGAAVPAFRAMVAADLPTTTGLVSVVAYNSTQTITIPTGATKANVTLWGASGGGGGAKASPGTGAVGGSGGGAGALIKYLSGITAGNTLALTVGAAGTAGATTPTNGGAGGNSTLASGTETITTLTANGGSGGVAANGASTTSLGGAGGTATNGDLNIVGQAGHAAQLGAATVESTVVTEFVAGPGGTTGLGLSVGGKGGDASSGTGVAGIIGIVGGCVIAWYS